MAILVEERGCFQLESFVVSKDGLISNIPYLKLIRLIVIMHTLKVKLDTDTNSINHSQTRLSFNSGSVQQRMLEVRERIDNHLGKTYQKLRLNPRKPLQLDAPFKEIATNGKTKSPANKDVVKVIQMKRRNNYSTAEQYHSPIFKNKQHCIHCIDDHFQGISNKEVMEYIHLIYQTYNIIDPLTRSIDDQSAEATISKNRNVGCQSIDSARTTKVNVGSIVEVSEFDIDKRETSKKHSKIVITLRSKTSSKHRRNATNPLYSQMKSIKCAIKPKQKLTFKQDNNANIPTYRYCFACEQAILQGNIRAHQQTCHMLRQAFTFSFPKIIGILNQKIVNIKAAISRQLLQVSSDQLSHRFSNLQQTISTWLYSIDSLSVPTCRMQYFNVKSHLTTTFLDQFQLLNKLNWFTRLRANILALPTI